MTSWPTLHLLIVELSGLVLGDPYPNQIARDVVLTRQAVERNFTAQVLLRHLAFELKAVTAMTTGPPDNFARQTVASRNCFWN